jgi:hypothetical protein
VNLRRNFADQLILDLDPEYPWKDADATVAEQALEGELGAVWGESWFDPLGDSWTRSFTWRGESFALDWDHWLGLGIVAHSTAAEALLDHLGVYFDAHPLPLAHPNDT